MQLRHWFTRGVMATVLLGTLAHPAHSTGAAGFDHETGHYPRWFLDGTAVSGRTAVGFAPLHGTSLDSSFAEARRDAERAFIHAEASLVEVELAAASFADQVDLLRLDTSRLPDTVPPPAGSSAPALQVLDSAVVGEMVLSLVGTRRSRAGLAAVRPTAVGERPAWLSDGATREPFQAVGMAPSYYYESSSWREAEASARRALAMSVSLRTRGLTRQDDDVHLATSVTSSRVELRGVQVISRWRDAGTYYVLVRASSVRPLDP